MVLALLNTKFATTAGCRYCRDERARKYGRGSARLYVQARGSERPSFGQAMDAFTLLHNGSSFRGTIRHFPLQAMHSGIMYVYKIVYYSFVRDLENWPLSFGITPSKKDLFVPVTIVQNREVDGYDARGAYLVGISASATLAILD